MRLIIPSTLLSHQLNLSEIISKHEGYEYANVIFKDVTHLF